MLLISFAPALPLADLEQELCRCKTQHNECYPRFPTSMKEIADFVFLTPAPDARSSMSLMIHTLEVADTYAANTSICGILRVLDHDMVQRDGFQILNIKHWATRTLIGSIDIHTARRTGQDPSE